MHFTEVLKNRNLNYKHITGAFTTDDNTFSRYMPETMGPGIVLFDHDNDGDNDIFVANSNSFVNDDELNVTPILYENLGGFIFEDITASSNFESDHYGMGAIAADYDGDGNKDLLLTGLGGPWLYKNLGQGKFENVSTAVGINPTIWQDNRNNTGKTWSTGALFFDVDNDLDLDLFIINYVKWSIDADIYTTYDTKNKGYTSPRSYEGMHPQLFIQENGIFVDQTETSGLKNTLGKSLGAALWDFDEDGKLDVIVANDTMQNFYFHNLGGGQFMEKALATGIAYDENGNARAGMGIDIADYLNNNSSVVAIGNFQDEPTSFFHYDNKFNFQEISKKNNIEKATLPVLTFGLLFSDFDLDGWQDLAMVNGHIEPGIHAIQPTVTYRQPMTILKNSGNGKFQDLSKTSGAAITNNIIGRGLASADLDNDGDLDIVVTENGGGIHLLRNDIKDQNYIRIHLIGSFPNTDAIGAVLKLSSNKSVQKRIIRTGGSYLSQSESIQTFGLGDQTGIFWLTIKWPDGRLRKLKLKDQNKTYIIKQHAKNNMPDNSLMAIDNK